MHTVTKTANIKSRRGRFLKRLLWTGVSIFILMNAVAYMHAFKFTHFDTNGDPKTKHASELSFAGKIKALILGINNPRPENKVLPGRPFEVVKLQSNKLIECWWLKRDSAKGSVILFHGYGGAKSTMLDKADIFYNLGYNTLLVDFMGSGGSEGNKTSIGFHEAVQVKSAFEFLKGKGEENIILFGTSLGAVAIMKALNDHHLEASSIIIECPFGTMLETVRARFSTMKLPSFPMANLLVFWGGVQCGFNAFSHNPVDYASNISTPTLLLYGEKDEKVSRGEIDRIFSNLQGIKELKTYLTAGHENYLTKYETRWTEDISSFISRIKSPGKY